MPQLLKFRVSHLDIFREWLDEEDADTDWLIHRLNSEVDSSHTARGHAFHKALERATHDQISEIKEDGITFRFEGDFELELPPIREVRAWKNYGGIEITGKVDCIAGNLIYDHKASMSFDAERYMRKFQWRYYLDIFKAQRFRWNIFEMREVTDSESWNETYRVVQLHTLEQMAYPDMERDCWELAQKLRLFAEQNNITALLPND